MLFSMFQMTKNIRQMPGNCVNFGVNLLVNFGLLLCMKFQIPTALELTFIIYSSDKTLIRSKITSEDFFNF